MENEGNGGVQKLKNGRPTTLDVEQELQLVELLKTMADRLYELSPKVVRELVYKFCDANGVSHRFNKVEQMAGIDWLHGFLQRYPTF